MDNTDNRLIKELLKSVNICNGLLKAENLNLSIEYPLDKDVVEQLFNLQNDLDKNDSEFAIFEYSSKINSLWEKLIKKAIICLRYYDTREPFLKTAGKKPAAYGVDSLKKYYDDYCEFEDLLYGGAKYYRDHVIHVFRVWVLGLLQMLKKNCAFMSQLSLPDGFKLNDQEKISMWTLVALTHDLGYPLEKSQQIIDKTRSMMKHFVSNPLFLTDVSFNGVQNSMNDFVLRLISSKMHKKNRSSEENVYEARLQSKYYFKFQKSLEQSKHGIISTLIIYKLLLYFLESDYSINEDYQFKEEDARQFYIRREILRAIASHTCHDVYQLNMFNLSFLLIVSDDSQEWGRKRIKNLYLDKEDYKYTFDQIDMSITVNNNTCSIKDSYEVQSRNTFEQILYVFKATSLNYKELFRDGQDTINRNFEFVKSTKITYRDNGSFDYEISVKISKDSPTTMIIMSDGEGRSHMEKVLNILFKNKTVRWEQVETMGERFLLKLALE